MSAQSELTNTSDLTEDELSDLLDSRFLFCFIIPIIYE